jgi:hypothetical protein
MERRKFAREFKLEAVRLSKDRGVSYVQAQDLNVHTSQLSSSVEFSLKVGIENSLAGALGRPFVAEHSLRFESQGSGDGGPAWRTDNDLGTSPPGTVGYGDCAAHWPRSEDGAQVYRAGLAPPAYVPRQVGRPSKLAPYLGYLRERVTAFRN